MMRVVSGVGASRGVAFGSVFVLGGETPVVPDVDDPGGAYAEAAEAVTKDLNDLREAAVEKGREEAAEILGAQALMAEDPMLAEAVTESLAEGKRLGEAIDIAADKISGMLAAMEDEYLAARSADVLEIADRIRHRLAGTSAAGLSEISEETVVVARTLTAADTAQLDPDLVLGFVTEEGGPTSHVAVIARSLGIPAVVGAPQVTEIAEGASRIAFDGITGDVVFDPTDEVVADYTARAAAATALEEAAKAFRGVRIEYQGRKMSVAANVGGSADVERAVAVEADGVGLFRTEFLFLDRQSPPSEEEQFEAYSSTGSAFDDPVVIRTLDIGGDKPASYLDTPPEENPFLGERGVRIYTRFPDLFTSQVRALLRASASGEIWVMLPMVATVEDLLGAKSFFESQRTELERDGVEIGSPKIGVMIEVPSAALIAPQLARHADFFSIGTNDLTQYTMAADRMNGQLARYSDAAHPAVLSLCASTARAATAAGISVSVCGEAASDPGLAALFAAMGMDKLSVSAPAVNRIKAVLAGLDPATIGVALDEALAAESADEARRIIEAVLDSR